MWRLLLVLLDIIALGGAGCGTNGNQPGGGSPGGGGTPLGQPMVGLVPGQWHWVPFPDSACGDGSPTGIGVNPGTGSDLVLFLDGGGACASASTCFTLHTATIGPFGPAEFASRTASTAGSILDRALQGNPFAAATLVFIPYCTGDVHGGDRIFTYTDSPGGTMHHVGHSNVLAYLKRVAATYTAPTRLVVAGSSAGGFGALVNYESVRNYYPAAQGFLVDDSGPPLEFNGGLLIQAGFASWGIADVLDPLCGGAGVCEADLSKGLAALIRKHPSDRFSLLSWNSDPIISAFYGIAQADFTTKLLTMTADVIDPVINAGDAASNASAFIAAGSSHTMLDAPGSALVTWLDQQVSGGAAWSTVKP